MDYSYLILICSICFLWNISAAPSKPQTSCRAYNETCCLNSDCCDNGCCFERRCVPYKCEICDRISNPCTYTFCIYGTYCYVRPSKEPCFQPPCPCEGYCK